MGKVGLFIIGLFVGLIGGALLVAPLMGGAMMGAGAGVGLSTGACMTVEAAQGLGYLSDEQVDEVMRRAAEDLSTGPLGEDQQIVGSAAACRDVMANLKQAEG